MFYGYRNESLQITKFIYKQHSVVPDVLTSVGTRFYHSQKVFTSCINAVPDVFTRVGTRLYHSQKVFTHCTGAVPDVFTGVGRNAPLSFKNYLQGVGTRLYYLYS